MDGLDCLGADSIGFDYLNLVKGAGGLLQGFGGPSGDDKGAAAAAEKARLEEQKRQAEQSASRMKLALGLTAGGAVLATVLAVTLGRK